MAMSASDASVHQPIVWKNHSVWNLTPESLFNIPTYPSQTQEKITLIVSSVQLETGKWKVSTKYLDL